MDKKACKNLIIVILIVTILFLGYLLIKKEYFTVPEQSNQDATFNNVNITGNFNLLPTGSIIMWNGNTAPDGWVLCDGTQNTPDLRGRFVLSQNPSNGGSANDGSCDARGFPIVGTGARISSDLCNEIGMNGGEAYHTLTIKEMPPHSHYSDNSFLSSVRSPNVNTGSGFFGLLAGTIGVTGYNWPHNNIPPYYVLAFIMKL
jgi:microcystin-dependent protein